MLRAIASALFLFVAGQAAAHTVELGRATVRGACASIETTTDSSLLIYRLENNRVLYGDGYVEVQAIVVPDKPLPNQKPDDLMTQCVTDVYKTQISNRSTSSEQLPEEDIYVRGINQCLEARGAKYRAELVFIRRSDVKCPEMPANR